MGMKRTWWIPAICFQSLIVVTTVLALSYPMRHRPLHWRSIHGRNNIVVAKLGPLPLLPPLQQLFPSCRNCYFNYFTPPVSQQRSQRVLSSSSSSSLDMSTDDMDDDRRMNEDRPPPPPAAANDMDTATTTTTTDANMIQEWEELYQSGRSSNSKIDSLMSERSSELPAYKIRVVSFDLDNTLWNTSATIDAANDALAQHIQVQLLRSFHITTQHDIRVEKVMGTLFTADRVKYAPVEGERAKSPVLLTKLRKDAIHQVVNDYLLQQQQQSTNQTTTDISTIVHAFVDHAFHVWTKARHDAISQQLASSTMDVMECIRSLRAPTNNPDAKILIGAITDGNSNPKLVPQLANVFDFYMNAETVGIGKPNKRIYLEAAKNVFQTYPTLFHDMMAKITMINDEISDDQIEELIGPWWIHIGDDFIKDIVASNSLKMRNIWTRELCSTKKVDVPPGEQQRQAQEQPSQRSVDDLMQVVNEKKVVEMSIGADTYLADTVSGEFATAVVDELRHVANILRKWQDEAFVSSTSVQRRMEEDDRHMTASQSETKSPRTNEEAQNTATDVKFCMACGTKLPAVAKFCSTCGAAQSLVRDG